MTTHDRDKIIAAAIGCIEGPYDRSRAITITGNEIERFYAIAHEAGAASRDAKIAELKAELYAISVALDDPRTDLTLTMVEVIQEHKQERDQLREQVVMLRDLLAWVDKYVGCAISGSIKEALAATEELK